MNVAYLSSDTVDNLKYFKDILSGCLQFKNYRGGKEWDQFSKIDDLLASNMDYSAILLDEYTEAENISILKKIRRSDKYFLTPVLFNEESNKNKFSDGSIKNIAKSFKDADNINNLIDTLYNKNLIDSKKKVLAFLYTRPSRNLVPNKSWTNKYFYCYPLVELFITENENYFTWTEELIERNIFSAEKLIDQFFCCSKCLSAHLKISGCCPECKSLNIKSDTFIHCFTCGFHAPEKEFIESDRLVCPNCHSKLKLFGSDYDRPLETGRCLDCKTVFIEAEFSAECMSCGQKHTSEDLKKMSFNEITLTENGRSKVQYNTMDFMDFFIDSSNYVSIELFTRTLGWLIQMQRRYKGQFFSIIGLKASVLHSNNHSKQLEIAREVKDNLRNIDICTKSFNGIIWIILPMTSSEDLDKTVLKRLDAYQYTTDVLIKGNELFRNTVFTSTQENVKELSAEQLLLQLEKHYG
jgi:hypothetical protein